MQPVEAEKIFTDEKTWISDRRQFHGISSAAPIKGLALSGGGIRASTAARGFIEELDQRGLLTEFDYISSVSGGAYIAGALTSHIGSTRELPFNENDHPIRPLDKVLTIATLPHLAIDFLLTTSPVVFYMVFLFLLALPAGGAYEDWKAWGPFAINASVMLAIYRWPGRPAKWLGSSTKDLREILEGMAVVLATGAVSAFIDVRAMLGLLGAAFVTVTFYIRQFPHKAEAKKAWILLWVATWAGTGAQLSKILNFYFFGVSGQSSLALMLGKLAILLLSSALLLYRSNAKVLDWNKSNALLDRYKANVSTTFLKGSHAKLSDVRGRGTPYPIFNVAANDGGSIGIFELAPLFSGSSTHGRLPTRIWLPELTLSEAVAVSAGAADTLAYRMKPAGLLGAILGGTGFWIPPRDNLAASGPPFVAHHMLLLCTKQKIALRLSDGGFVDNLGLLALLERRLPFILCFDAGYDPAYTFDDLRKVCNAALDQGIARVKVPDIASIHASFRFRQNDHGLVCGDIDYLDANGRAQSFGKLVLVKLYRTFPCSSTPFNDAPHFSTLDQRLSDEQLKYLYDIGRRLGQQYAASRTTAAVQDEMAEPAADSRFEPIFQSVPGKAG